jgi:hypothetical protein
LGTVFVLLLAIAPFNGCKRSNRDAPPDSQAAPAFPGHGRFVAGPAFRSEPAETIMVVWSGRWQTIVGYDSQTLRQSWIESLPESLRPEVVGATNDLVFLADKKRNVLVYSTPHLKLEATLSAPGEIAEFYSKGDELIAQLSDDRYFEFDRKATVLAEVPRPNWCPNRPRRTPPECPTFSEAGFCTPSGVSPIGADHLMDLGHLRTPMGTIAFASVAVQPLYVLGLDETSNVRWQVQLPFDAVDEYLVGMHVTETELEGSVVVPVYPIHSRNADTEPYYRAVAIDGNRGSVAWSADFKACEGVRRWNERLIGYRCRGPAPVISLTDGHRHGELVPTGDPYP